jgi:hypothetical protein
MTNANDQKSSIHSLQLDRQHNALARLIRIGISFAAALTLGELLISLLLHRSGADATNSNLSGSGLIIILCIPAGRALLNAVLYIKSGQLSLAGSATLTFLLLVCGAALVALRSVSAA